MNVTIDLAPFVPMMIALAGALLVGVLMKTL